MHCSIRFGFKQPVRTGQEQGAEREEREVRSSVPACWGPLEGRLGSPGVESVGIRSICLASRPIVIARVHGAEPGSFVDGVILAASPPSFDYGYTLGGPSTRWTLLSRLFCRHANQEK